MEEEEEQEEEVVEEGEVVGEEVTSNEINGRLRRGGASSTQRGNFEILQQLAPACHCSVHWPYNKSVQCSQTFSLKHGD